MLCGSVSWTDRENTYSILSMNGLEHDEMEQMGKRGKMIQKKKRMIFL